MTDKKKSKPKKKAAKKITAIRVDPELWAEAHEVAELQGTSATAVLAQCLKAGLPQLRRVVEEFRERMEKGE